jgi:hypothetical protein
VGLLDRLLGRDRGVSRDSDTWGGGRAAARPPAPGAGRSDDEVAIERYRYLLRTAPPEQVEQAHAEAFAKLTPEQRRQVLAELSADVPPGERVQSDDPRSLARMATRAEMRRPGTLERSFSRGGMGGMGGMGMGGMIAGGLLASVAGAFVGTAIADAMFDFNDSGEGADAAGAGDSGEQGFADQGGGDQGGGDYGGGDFGGGDFGGGDFGGGDMGGDFGGGFGGGDFGGGGDF